MLTFGIADANATIDNPDAHIAPVRSVVGLWLAHELTQAGYQPVAPAHADVVFAVHAGIIDWVQQVRRELKRHGIQPDRRKRNQRPYIIAGGQVDSSPLTACMLADAVAIGEAYQFVRQLLVLAKTASIAELDEWITAYPHAISATQLDQLVRDPQRPWLFVDPPPAFASPDPYVDWEGTPLVRGDDHVIRALASKGCHLACKFCATTYRQTYRVRPSDAVIDQLRQLDARGERVSLITNDAAALPFFRDTLRYAPLDHQSMTIMALQDEDTFAALLRGRIRLIRLGVEGLSERIRTAFGKPISDDLLIERAGELTDAGKNLHLFFIVGAPYESEEDWAAFREMYRRLTLRLRRGYCRLKFTAFTPNAPTPLMRFTPTLAYAQRWQAFEHWALRNWKSRHVMFIAPRRVTLVQNVLDGHALDKRLAPLLPLGDETYDLLPTLEDAKRAHWEVVQWPRTVAQRYRLSDVYRRWMGVVGDGAAQKTCAIDAAAD